jgi:peroxiredoxin
MNNVQKLFAAAIGLLPSMAWSQNFSFTVKGKVGHYSAPYKAYLLYTAPDGVRTDSCLMQDGVFSFTDSARSPRKAYFTIKDKAEGFDLRRDEYQEFCLEPETVRLESPDSIDNIQVTGGKVNADFAMLKKMLVPATQKLTIVSKEWKAATAEKKKSPGFKEDIEKRTQALYTQQKQIGEDYARNNPGSMVSLLIIQDYYNGGGDLSSWVPLFNALSPEIRSTSIGVYLANIFEGVEKRAAGTPAPDFTLPDRSGKNVSLHDFKGKYVLIDFWASWCGPCRAENPNVVRAYNRYKDKGFTILGVSLDDSSSKSKWIAAFQKDNLTWTQVCDGKGWQTNPVQEYFVKGIPQNFLIDPQGKIVAKDLRGEDLDKKLNELLN